MNKASNINTKTYLEYLRGRRAKIDALIKAVVEFDDDGSASDTVDNSEDSGGASSSSPGSGMYEDMTIAAAATHYIRTAGKPQSTLNIVRGIERGGLRSASKSLYRTVYNTLTSRLDKELTRRGGRGGKWGLKEWEQEVKQ